jgi:Ca-activated chloride channel homolog
MMYCKHISLLSFVLVLLASTAHSQDQLDIYRGNTAYSKGEYETAKDHYNKAIDKNPNSYKGTYNLGNATYKAENFEDAVSHYQQAISSATDDVAKAEAMHNLGNTYLQSSKLEEAIKTYKDALRNNPTAEDTRYNLAFAQKMMKQQEKEEQEKEEKGEDEDKDKDKDKEEQEQEEEDKGDKEEEKDGEKEEDEDKEGEEEKEKDPTEEGEEQEKEQPKPINLTPREAEQMLEAAKNEDQKIQMQLKQKQPSSAKKIEKDW